MENEEYEKEKDIKGNSNSISYEVLETILEQMRNCICLINCKKGGNGTGFFCKFPFPDKYNLLPVLITNNHVLEQKDISNGEEIKILMKKKDPIYLKIDKSRKVYTDEKYDITIIEIKPLDNLNIDSFLEIDDTIFKEKPNIEYRQKSVYLLHYPHSKNVEFSPGTIRSIDENDKNILHLCYTQEGSSGSPIINLFNFKVIGIHKGSKTGDNCNLGSFIKNPIQHFYKKNNKYYNKLINKKKNSFNFFNKDYYEKEYKNEIMKYIFLKNNNNYNNDNKYAINKNWIEIWKSQINYNLNRKKLGDKMNNKKQMFKIIEIKDININIGKIKNKDILYDINDFLNDG